MTRQLDIEVLENRCLPSVATLMAMATLPPLRTAVISVPTATILQTILGPELVINGTFRDDTITIDDGPNMTVTVRMQTATSLLQTRTFNKSDFNYIRVTGLEGNDRVTNNSACNAGIDGGAGNDSLSAGNGIDRLTGGLGDDVLTGGANGYTTLVEVGDVDFTLTDTTLTGLGNDTLSAIDEAHLTGGAGHNTIDCRTFSNRVVLRGLGGDDALIGGWGNDELDGGADSDSLIGNHGDDRLVGGPGTDILAGGHGDDTGVDSLFDHMASDLAAILHGEPDASIEHWGHVY